MSIRATFNHARFRPGSPAGHYESYFQRANHPSRPLAFWIRYTVFSPAGRPQDAIGELWAVWFDGESGRHVALKREVLIAECDFGTERFSVRIGDAHLLPGVLAGLTFSGGHRIAWQLNFRGDAAPAFLLPPKRYASRFPRAKSLVGLPMARYDGVIEVDGQAHRIEDWVGSQNHNWGSRHTDHYAYGQVAGFDTHPDSFLDLATARIRLGPVWTPFLTPLVLRHGGREHALTSIPQSLRAHGKFRYFEWNFSTQNDEVAIGGTIAAPREAFVALTYSNPPGGIKHCLNTKIGECRLDVLDKASGRTETLLARNRALFEIVPAGLDPGHGIPIGA